MTALTGKDGGSELSSLDWSTADLKGLNSGLDTIRGRLNGLKVKAGVLTTKQKTELLAKFDQLRGGLVASLQGYKRAEEALKAGSTLDAIAGGGRTAYDTRAGAQKKLEGLNSGNGAGKPGGGNLVKAASEEAEPSKAVSFNFGVGPGGLSLGVGSASGQGGARIQR